MQYNRVSSSNLAYVGYDESTATLGIQFHSGSNYLYYNVPMSVYIGLMRAPSKGGYHADFIKDRYRYQQVG